MKPTELVRHAERQGWRAEETKKGWVLKSPDGITQVLIHGTPSDVNWHRNAIRLMRRGGFIWPPPKR